MDWIEEKMEDFRRWLKNLSICKALLMYLVLAILAAAATAFVTVSVLTDWSRMIYEHHAADMPNAWHAIENADLKRMLFFQKLAVVLPFLYLSIAVLASAVLFWHKRLKKPFLILKNSASFIREDNLDFKTEYDSRDEMGEHCRSFEDMRQELVRGKEEMWKLIEEQREINAAFAHDLRTPLTVLRGYSDFLYRYIPEGKISADKLTGTLKLMSEHIQRLESYSYTMKGIRSFEELEPLKVEMETGRLASRIWETTEALNRIGDMEICFEFASGSEEYHSSASSWREAGKWLLQIIYVDENLILEVVENLLSNAIRYARKRVNLLLKIKESEEMLYLYVSDDGPGFTGEELQKAAQPYFHGVSPGMEEENTHFGIGLHISRILCKKHGGTLSLANSIDGGALVSVSFSYRKS